MRVMSIKIIFCFICLILLLSETSNIFGQNRNRTKTKTKITVEKLTNDERRQMVESRMLEGEYQHDGSGELMYIGTIESVPALLKVLENHPPHIYLPCKNDLEIPPQPPPLIINGVVVVAVPQRENPVKDCSPRKMFICTYSHALSALKKITGQNFVDYEDWKNWWNEYSKSKEISKQK